VSRSGFWLSQGTSWTGLLLSSSGVSVRVSSRDQDISAGVPYTTTRVHVYAMTRHEYIYQITLP